MLTPVVCFTCGCPVGDVEDLFREMRAARARTVLAERGTAPARAAADAGLQLDCSDLLEALMITKDCCRKTLVAALDFAEYY